MDGDYTKRKITKQLNTLNSKNFSYIMEEKGHQLHLFGAILQPKAVLFKVIF